MDLTTVKPRARAALRLLMIHREPVHREVLIAALWPDVGLPRGTRCLHVALSSLRQAIEFSGAKSASLLRREGDAYRFALPVGAWMDTVEFEQAVRQGSEARSLDDIKASTAAYRRALSLYSGALLPEDGPAEWILPERDRLQDLAVDAAIALAGMRVDLEEYTAGAAVCAWGLRIDRYRDELWEIRIAALTRAGHRLAAARTERRYRDALIELGIDPEQSAVPSGG